LHAGPVFCIILIFLIIVFITGCSSNDASHIRTINFSGYEWKVKSSNIPVGPGPNLFSESTHNVHIDTRGFLHIKITNNKNGWECAEIILNTSYGYGTYVFTIASEPDSLENEVVLGLFTWDDHPEYSNREIDIEFSRWENPDNMNAQYVVQPWFNQGNMYRFDVRNNSNISTHSFEWHPDKITFQSYYGAYTTQPSERNIINSWEYKGNDIPLPGNENARINLWLIEGRPPTNAKEIEVVIEEFKFIPENVSITT
jgi:hypothetical protein